MKLINTKENNFGILKIQMEKQGIVYLYSLENRTRPLVGLQECFNKNLLNKKIIKVGSIRIQLNRPMTIKLKTTN